MCGISNKQDQSDETKHGAGNETGCGCGSPEQMESMLNKVPWAFRPLAKKVMTGMKAKMETMMESGGGGCGSENQAPEAPNESPA